MSIAARTQSKIIKITPDLAADATAATVAYADKDMIGDVLTLADVVQNKGGTCVLQSLVLKSKVTTANLYDIIFLNAAPAATATGDNNTAAAMVDGDIDKIVGIVSVAAADHNASQAAFTVATKVNIGLVLQCAAGSTSLYAIVVARGAVTFGAAGDLIIDLGFLQD